MSTRIRRSIAQHVAIAAVILIAFGRIVSHGWVNFDDPIHVTENPSFFPLSWRDLGGFWVRPYEHLYVPASYMLFAAECMASRWLYGEGPMAVPRPGLFHAVSLALHVAASLLVLRILRRFTTQPWAAVVGGLVFALHPLQVESVAWIAEQRGLLAAVFSLLAIDQFLEWTKRTTDRSPATAHYAIATGALVVALLAKPSAVVTPLVAFALASHDRKVPRPTLIWALAPWIVLAVAAAVCTRFVQPADLTRVHVPLMTRPLIAGDAIAFYAGKLLVPVDLCVVYGRTPQATLADPFAPVAAGLVAIAFAGVAFWPRGREWRLPLAVFVIPLLPVLGFTAFAYQNHSTVADRYMYLATLGPALGAAMASDRLRRADAARAGWAPPLAVCLAVAVCYLPLTWRQAGLWRDSLTLFTRTLDSGHESAVALNNLGVALTDLDRAGEALPHLLRAVELDAADARAQSNLGVALTDLDRAGEALPHLLRAVELDAADARAQSNLGVALTKLDRAGEALPHLLRAVELDAVDSRAHSNLGVALTELDRAGEALPHLLRAVELDAADAKAWFNLGNAHVAAGDLATACTAFERSLELDGGRFKAWNNLGLARLVNGDAAGAEAAWRRSIRIRPDFGDARLNLAKLLLSRGELASAADHVQAVLEQDRSDAEAHNLLGVILAETGQPREAVGCFEAAVKFAPRREDFRANLERARQALAAGQSP
jgi:tetratricopeptide (TPR) repeat protein